MIALIQRVSQADVKVSGNEIGAIGRGLLVLLGIDRGDSESQANRLVERVIGYRVFEDNAGKMNLSVQNINGGILVVSQFTLAADTKKGMRAGFSTAAEPSIGESLYNYFVKTLQAQFKQVATGEFGANMQVSLCNDGPVSFILKA